MHQISDRPEFDYKNVHYICEGKWAATVGLKFIMSKVGRNDSCPCGSGRKYKQCCLLRSETPAANKQSAYMSIPKALQEAVEHHQAGRLNRAEAIYRQILRIEPNHPDALHLSGVVAQQEGRNGIAVELITRAIRVNPREPMYYNNLGMALEAQGELDAAAEGYRQALLLKPGYARAHYNLGNTLQAQGNLDEAVEHYHQAISFQPVYAEAHNNLGAALQDQGRLNEAVEHYRLALALKPDYAEAHNNLGNALKDQGKLDEAVGCYRTAISLRPDYADARTNLLFLYSYYSLIDPREYLALARGWEQVSVPEHELQLAHNRFFQRLPLAGRRLKVGYTSGDFRRHPVSYFIEQLFAHHDRTRIELFAYSTNPARDEVTERLQTLVDHWIPVVGIPDGAVRDRIEADEIDVLVDLSGHTAHNRLGVFARRAAPVQAHYLGYFASTGLSEMDYFIGDAVLTPPETDQHFSEQIWRMPKVRASYDGKNDAPLPDWRPDQDGSIWLGSFNNLGKLTSLTLMLWAKVLHALPQGKLLLKTSELADADNRRRILDEMAGLGISQDRIELLDNSVTPSWREHMASYDRLDIALDPVGAHGGYTTTCDALWMGAPVIALEGDRMASRMTASILNAVGCPEWVARTEAEYIDKVVALARDVEQRKALRSTQRGRMAASPLCDAKDLAVSLENAYLEMFERWLEKPNGDHSTSAGNNMSKTGPDDPCPCGSGREYSLCCLKRTEIMAPGTHVTKVSLATALQVALEHHRAGRLPQAEAIYRQIIQVDPDHPDALHFMGLIAYQAGRNESAVELIGRAIRFNPSCTMHSNMGLVLHAQGNLDAAVEHYHKALAHQPDYAEALNNLGNALEAQGKLDEAVEHYRKAISIKPDSAEALNNLGLALKNQGRLDEAVEYYRKALSFKPDYAKVINNLGNTLTDQGNLGEAVGLYQKALSINPNLTGVHSNLLFLYSYHVLIDPREYLSLARGWEQACVPVHERQLAHARVFQRRPLAGRRLRVGYVSGDFREHPVSYFIERLFAHHDRARIELFAYSANPARDEVTERLQALVDHWIPVAGMDDAATRDRIKVDGIDALIDLSGHTALNRLGVFARRAAPVQAHYLGYFASTGLTEMDYWIGDAVLTPPETDDHFSEQVWRLPRVWVTYNTLINAPEPDWRPARDGSVWLGSFNNLSKLTPATLALWAKVLHALPEGKLLLKNKALADAGNRRRILDAMGDHGIAEERIELQRDTNWSDYMAQYNRLDIALDPVGAHGGGTTTCDALWMGVPVVHALGDRATSRFTAAMLEAVGHPEWIAQSEAKYVDKVVALARDVERRKALRISQRERMASSPLCDAKDLAVSLENAYFEMFERWQARQPATIAQVPGIS